MRTDELYLTDIVTASDRILHFLEDVDGLKGFLSDDKSQDAILMNLIIIGEAANKMSAATTSVVHNIPWKKIAGFRHIAVHGYFSLDMASVYEIATNHVSPLRDSILVVLKSAYPDTYQKYVIRKKGKAT